MGALAWINDRSALAQRSDHIFAIITDAILAKPQTDLQNMVPASRNEQLLAEAEFIETELFYVGMAWRGWIAYA